MGEIFSGGGQPFVNSAMKTQIANAGVPFGITGARARVENQFGDFDTRFEIVISAKAAKAAGDAALEGEWLLALSHTDVREDQAEKVLAYLVTQPQYGPAYLTQFTSKKGNTGWQISDAPGDSPVQAMPASGEGTPFEGGAADDGIPY
jgi:hypothetical protein